MTPIDKVRAFLRDRGYAYRRQFDGELGKIILADLAVFCRANESTFHEDPRVAAMLDGRREVYLRIQDHLRLSDNEMFARVTGGEAQINSRLERQVIHDE